MAVPKRKTSKSRRNMRRSHHGIKMLHLATDKETGELHRAHCVSKEGTYKGTKAVNQSN